MWDVWDQVVKPVKGEVHGNLGELTHEQVTVFVLKLIVIIHIRSFFFGKAMFGDLRPLPDPTSS